MRSSRAPSPTRAQACASRAAALPPSCLWRRLNTRTRGLARVHCRKGAGASGAAESSLAAVPRRRARRACMAHETQEHPRGRRQRWRRRPAAARTEARRAAQRAQTQRQALSRHSGRPQTPTHVHVPAPRASPRARWRTRCSCHPACGGSPPHAHVTSLRAAPESGRGGGECAAAGHSLAAAPRWKVRACVCGARDTRAAARKTAAVTAATPQQRAAQRHAASASSAAAIRESSRPPGETGASGRSGGRQQSTHLLR